MGTIRQTKEWKEKRKEFITGKSCLQCNSKENLVPHHPQKKNSLTDEEYMSFKGTIIMCKRCHFAHHKRMNLCPKCKSKYKKIRYETCFNCLPEKVKEIISIKKEKKIINSGKKVKTIIGKSIKN